MIDGRWMPRWLVPSVVVAVALPVLVAAIAQRDAQWHPVYDLAMTELRVRDVGGPHTPLIGLQGRIGPTGSHPGPISFYLLAPAYRLLGSSAFALQAATAMFHATAVLTAVLVAARRRDGRVVAGLGLLLVLLVQGYGLGALIEPWNPQLPVLWFAAFLVAAWAVVDGDLPMLLPAVFAASICAQTHVPYLAVTAGLGAGLALAAMAWVRSGRADDGRGGARWLLLAVGVGTLLWVPPLIDQAIHDPGNLRQLADHLGTPTADPIGVRQAAGFVVDRMDAGLLVVGETKTPGTFVRVLRGPGPDRHRGQLTLGLWAVSVVIGGILRHRRLLALHAVVAGASVIAVVAISRIYGVPWPYLMLWGWTIGALMAFAVAATAVAAAARWAPLRWAAIVSSGATVATVAALAIVSVRLLVIAPDATTETPDQTAQLARVLPITMSALDAGDGVASGHGGRYLVEWFDAVDGGSVGIGLVNELIRHGYDVGVAERDGVKMGVHRVRPAEAATAKIVVASGGWIELWNDVPGAVLVTLDDPRSDQDRADFAEARADAVEGLRTVGRGDLIDQLDQDLFGIALNAGLPREVTVFTGEMIDIGVPTAVFVLPAGATL